MYLLQLTAASPVNPPTVRYWPVANIGPIR